MFEFMPSRTTKEGIQIHGGREVNEGQESNNKPMLYFPFSPRVFHLDSQVQVPNAASEFGEWIPLSALDSTGSKLASRSQHFPCGRCLVGPASRASTDRITGEYRSHHGRVQVHRRRTQAPNQFSDQVRERWRQNKSLRHPGARIAAAAKPQSAAAESKRSVEFNQNICVQRIKLN